MKRAARAFLGLSLMLAACQSYGLVSPGRQAVGDFYSVAPEFAWSRAVQGHSELWTVDGPGLEAVRLLRGVADGEPLLVLPQGREQAPVFREYMSESEVAELLADTIARLGSGAVKTGDLQPAAFGKRPGFRFALEYLTSAGLQVDGFAVGTIADKKLYLIVYTAAREYYFARYAPHVEALLASIETR